MSRKRKRGEEQDGIAEDTNGVVETGTSQETIAISSDSLSQIYSAFTAQTLTQPPLLDGTCLMALVH
jgi:hypothetical protein